MSFWKDMPARSGPLQRYLDSSLLNHGSGQGLEPSIKRSQRTYRFRGKLCVRLVLRAASKRGQDTIQVAYLGTLPHSFFAWSEVGRGTW